MRLLKKRYVRNTARAGACRVLVVAMLAGVIAVPPPAVADWTTIDELEPNDTPVLANDLPADGTIMNAALEPAGDVDWFKVSVTAGVTYRFETGPNTNELDGRTDTYLHLYESDGATEIAHDDDGGPALFSLITYTPPADTILYLKVRHFNVMRTGPYGVRAYQEPAPSMVTITGAVTVGAAAISDINVTDYYIDEWFTAFEDAWTEGMTTVSAADGSYTLTGPAGAHRVRFTDPGRDYLSHFYPAAVVFRYADDIVLADAEIATGIDAVMVERQPLETDVTDIVRVSVHTDGTEGDDLSYYGSVSADGRYVVFQSWATNLVDGDTNGAPDIFIRDLVENTTERVSINTDGTEGDGGSYSPSISADNRYVTFYSWATNLVDGDTNGAPDIFIRDLVENTTERVSVTSDGTEADAGSAEPSISADGRYVAFHSRATNLVDDDTNNRGDIFIRDLVENTTERVSISTDGTEGDGESNLPRISADGRYVAFYSWATNLVDDDTNDTADIFIRDLVENTTERVSVSAEGTEGDGESSSPVISADGRYVAFDSWAKNLVDDDTNNRNDIFVRDLVEGTMERVSVHSDGSEGDSHSYYPSISADGRYVAFQTASNLDPNDDNRQSDIYVHDRAWRTTRIVSAPAIGVIADGASYNASISDSGDYIVFDSGASDFGWNDQNAAPDVFRAEMLVVPPPPSGISGTVSGQASAEATLTAPLEGAAVTVWSATASPAVVASATTAADGTYMAPVDPGEYIVQFEAEGYEPEYFDGAADISEATAVTVTTQHFTEDIDATLLLATTTGFDLVELWGEDRYATAIAIAQEAYPDGLPGDGSGTVVLARGERFPDALAGSALAGLVDGPILLTRSGRLLDEVAEEIERLGAVRVILLGEELALSAEVEAAVEVLDGVEDVMRFGGTSRYETADAIAEYVIDELGDGFGGEAFVATGARFPDSLAASPVIGAQRMPLFLAHPSAGLSESSVSVMTGGEVRSATILGGTLAVSAGVETALDTLLGAQNVDRVEGGDRYETAALVAEFGVSLGHTWDLAGVASGVRFPDSLTGGAYQARSGSVMLLTRETTLNEYTQEALSDNAGSIYEVRVYGGPLAIAQEVRDAIREIFETQ